jgi:hypothetical protein
MVKASRLFVGAAVLLSAGLFGQSAWSGKPERDKVDELQPKIKETKEGIKSACGCDVAVDVKFDTYKTVDTMSSIGTVLGGVVNATKNYCVKPADKKALCSNLSTVEISWTTSLDHPKMEGKTLKLHTAPASYNTESETTKVLNSF